MTGTADPALLAVIERFAAGEAGRSCFDPRLPLGDCFVVSRLFAGACADAGVDARVVEAHNYDGAGVVSQVHRLVRAGGVFVDWTFRQFGVPDLLDAELYYATIAVPLLVPADGAHVLSRPPGSRGCAAMGPGLYERGDVYWEETGEVSPASEQVAGPLHACRAWPCDR